MHGQFIQYMELSALLSGLGEELLHRTQLSLSRRLQLYIDDPYLVGAEVLRKEHAPICNISRRAPGIKANETCE